MRQLVDLLWGEELRLVDENPFFQTLIVEYFFQHLVHVGFRVYPPALPFDADAGADYAVLLPIVDNRFHAEVVHAPFFEIVGGSQEHCRFGGAHCAVFKIEFASSVRIFVVHKNIRLTEGACQSSLRGTKIAKVERSTKLSLLKILLCRAASGLIGESSDLILKIVVFPEKCGGRVLRFLIVSLILQTNGGVPIAAVPRDEKEIRWKKNCQ